MRDVINDIGVALTAIVDEVVVKYKGLHPSAKSLYYLVFILGVSNVLALAAVVRTYSERHQYQAGYEAVREDLEAMTRTKTGAITNAFVCKARTRLGIDKRAAIR